MAKDPNAPRPDDPERIDSDVDREIEFRESEIKSERNKTPGTRACLRGATELPTETPTGAWAPLEIEWMDEDRPPASGKIFAQPAPEPPRQHFEQIRQKPVPIPAPASPLPSRGAAAKPAPSVPAPSR